MAAVKDYSVEEKLASLVRLQKIDSKLDEIKILKGELPMEVSDLEDEIQGLTSRKNRIEEEINGMQQFIEQKKHAIKDADALVKKYEKQSEAVKNSREFEAINKEIEMQQLEGKLAEKHIRDANEELADKVKDLGQIDRRVCREWVKNKFSLQKMTEEYIHVYRRVAASRVPIHRHRRNFLHPVQRVADGHSEGQL